MTCPSPILPLCLLSFAALSCSAQSPSVHRYSRTHEAAHIVSAGAYGSLGLNTVTGPVTRKAGLQAQAGIYADYARFAFRPGIDARVFGSATGLGCPDGCGSGSGSARLIGPRLSFVKGIAHPYVEGLFGTGHQDDVLLPVGATGSFSGTEKLFAAGLDLVAERHVEVRVLEYTVGHLGPATGVRLQSFTTGLVFRFP